MTSTPINWSMLIAEMADESFGIPPDVTFQIVEKSGEKRRLEEVMAHKMLLAMVSPTFKTMFYATDVGDKSTNVIKIEKTTAPAFRIMMNAVYNVRSIEASLEGKSVDQVFDVVNLIERYQIVKLMEAAKECLANYPIDDDSVLEVAGDAMEYTGMFEAEAKLLLLTCAKFLKPKLKDLKAVSRYAKDNQDRKEEFSTLLALMNDVTPIRCPNCNYEACHDGETVKDDEFKEGLVVTNNKDTDRGIDFGTGKVTEVTATHVTVVTIEPGGHGFEFGRYTSLKSSSYFLYSCN